MRAWRETVFAVSAVLFIVAGLYHLHGALRSMADPALATFHAAFVVIDPVTAFLLLRRPDWFRYAFAVFTLQQIYSHGLQAWTAWRAASEVDYVSLVVIVLMPSLLALLICDGAMRKTRAS